MAKRQFGSVRRLKSGRWQVRFRDEIGERITAPDTFATKGDASRFLASTEADIARGTYLNPNAGQKSLKAWAEEWLMRPGKKPASVVRDRQGLDVFMPSLGNMTLTSITPLHIQRAISERAKEASPSTVARDFAALKALLNAAIDTDQLGRSPVRGVALPTFHPPERKAISPESLMRLVREVPEPYSALVLTASILGLRWGEAIALRVRDIDFTRGTVSIYQVVEELEGSLRIVSEGKSKAALRTLAAPEFLLDDIKRHLILNRKADMGNDQALVFLGPRGGILRRRIGERILRPATIRAGLPGITFHVLRHAAVSSMVDEGVHPRVMAARAGHGSIKLTLDLYAHVSDNADREVAAALQERFREFL